MAFFSIEPAKEDRRQHFFEAFLWIMALLGFALGWIQSNAPLIISASFFFFYLGAICLHEFGHALATSLLKGDIQSIRLGRSTSPTGNHLTFKPFGWRLEIYALPYAGVVRSLFYSNHYRRDVCLMIAAGPVMSLLAFLSGLLILNEFGPTSKWSLLGLSWSAVNFLLLINTAFPYERQTPSGPFATDGLRIFRMLSLKKADVEQKILAARLQRDVRSAADSLKKLSSEELIAKCANTPDKIENFVFLFDKLESENDLRCEKYLLALISHPKAPKNYAMQILDQYLTRQLAKASPPAANRLDELSLRLLELNDVISTRGTRGSILIHLGQAQEGKLMLEDVLIKTTNQTDRFYCTAFLALAERQLGNPEKAREHAAVAKKIDPSCPTLKRVADLISE